MNRTFQFLPYWRPLRSDLEQLLSRVGDASLTESLHPGVFELGQIVSNALNEGASLINLADRGVSVVDDHDAFQSTESMQSAITSYWDAIEALAGNVGSHAELIEQRQHPEDEDHWFSVYDILWKMMLVEAELRGKLKLLLPALGIEVDTEEVDILAAEELPEATREEMTASESSSDEASQEATTSEGTAESQTAKPDEDTKEIAAPVEPSRSEMDDLEDTKQISKESGLLTASISAGINANPDIETGEYSGLKNVRLTEVLPAAAPSEVEELEGMRDLETVEDHISGPHEAVEAEAAEEDEAQGDSEEAEASEDTNTAVVERKDNSEILSTADVEGLLSRDESRVVNADEVEDPLA